MPNDFGFRRMAALTGLMAAVLAVGGCAGMNGGGLNNASGTYDVRAWGAIGDGKTIDTPAINAAIRAAAAHGGGTVRFPAGTYASFSIHLQSNVTLYLDNGATILAATPAAGTARPGTVVAFAQPATPPPDAPVMQGGKPATYDQPELNAWAAFQDFGHSHFHNSLMWGENLHDVSILGPGMIDGKGLLREATNANWGNKALALKNCVNVTLRDVTFFRGGHFAVLATGVDGLTIDNCKFDTNRDGVDIDCCYNVRVSNCYVNAPTDDGLCLKSSYALGKPRATENVTITNCHLSGFAVGTMLDGTYDRGPKSFPASDGPFGRIKFGTESNGGFKNITISNCVFDHSRGLAIESVDGGIIEDVTITNLAMRDVNMPPIFIRIGNRARGPAETTPVGQIRRVNISDITASGVGSKYPCLIVGLPGHPIEDVRISNVRIAYEGGGTAAQAALVLPENERTYPEPSMFGVLPAAGFYVRHATGLEMHHIDMTFDKADARPVFVLDDVGGADFQHMKVQRFENVPLFKLDKVTDFSTQTVRGIADVKRDAVNGETIGK